MNSQNQSKSWRKYISWVVIGLFIVPGILLFIMFSFRSYKKNIIRNDTKITQVDGIESIEKVNLGGVDQWILIRAEDRSNPVLLWLHGGPGSPTMPVASQHDTELVKHFVVVHWDQRGAGKSYSPEISVNTMVVDQFVSDTYELSQALAKRFDVPKIYLIGHSWGSQIGILTVERHPDLYYAFIGIGQFVNSLEGDTAGYQFALEQATSENNQKALGELEAIGPPPWMTADQRSTNAQWVNAFGGSMRQFTMQDYFSEMIYSPEYTLQDLLGCMKGQWSLGNLLFSNGELNRINLFEQAPRVDVPVYFFQGRYDYSTPGEVVMRYYEFLDAPQKSLVWFEQSAHFPHWEEPQKFVDELLEVLSEVNQDACLLANPG